jgi:hypothetical protein
VLAEPDIGGQRDGVRRDDDLAEVEHDSLVGDAQRAACVLLDQQHREAGLAQPGGQLHDLGDDLRRQPERRLIQQQHPRPGHQGARDDEHLPLAAGQGPGRPVPGPGEDREPLVSLGQRPGPGDPPGPPERAEPEVLLDGELGDHALALGHVRHLAAGHVLSAAAGHVLPADQHPAPARPDHPADGAQQGRLAGPVRPEHGGNGGRADGDRDALQGEHTAVARHHLLDRQRGRLTHRSPPPRGRRW